jgi:hypothetical protein
MKFVFKPVALIGIIKELNKGMAMRFNLSDFLFLGVMLAFSGSVTSLVAQETNRMRPAKPAANVPGVNETKMSDMGGTGVDASLPVTHPKAGNSRVFTAGAWDLRPQSYLLLARPAKSEHDKERMPSIPPNLHELPVQPYAYGWFGATMDRHPRRSFGVRKSYTQWSFE